jgi:hypothetical protein
MDKENQTSLATLCSKFKENSNYKKFLQEMIMSIFVKYGRNCVGMVIRRINEFFVDGEFEFSKMRIDK